MTLEDVFRQRWHLIDASIPYNHDFAIPTFWRSHPELGSPISTEQGIEGGAVAQPFTGGIVVWDAQGGARLATE